MMKKTGILILSLFLWTQFQPANAQVRIAQSKEQKAILLCVPGLTENPKTFKKMADEMAPHGVSTYAVSVQGYEITQGGKKQEKVDFCKSVETVKDAAQSLRKRNPGVPVILLGESTGGAIALKAAALHPKSIDGLICAVPTWKIRSTFKIGCLATLDMTLLRAKRHASATSLVIKRATDNPDLRKAMIETKSRRQRFSVIETAKFLRFMNASPKTACQVKDLPVLFVHGLNDKVSSPNACATLFSKISSKRKTYMVDAEAGHLICEEGQYSRPLFLAIKDWLVRTAEHEVSKRPQAILTSADSAKSVDWVLIRENFARAGVSPSENVAHRPIEPHVGLPATSRR
ncbi:alpha/beta fold hydrolase [bacterium]|nr:alpha/beta fold hydrolase [bacterium]